MTKRELEVETLLYGKKPLKQIGQQLEITTRTVKAHCQRYIGPTVFKIELN